MESLLELFYDTMVRRLPHSSAYKQGIKRWEDLHPSLALEDAARYREYEWGYLTFSASIRFALELFPPESE